MVYLNITIYTVAGAILGVMLFCLVHKQPLQGACIPGAAIGGGWLGALGGWLLTDIYGLSENLIAAWLVPIISASFVAYGFSWNLHRWMREKLNK